MTTFETALETPALKMPPHSVEAEQSVLGGLMLDNQVYDLVTGRLAQSDFYRREHQLIFQAICQLAEKDTPFDVVTLSEHLDRAGFLEQTGGLVYLAELAKNTPTAANINAYANIVRERAILRKLVSVAHRIAESAFSPEGRSTAELLDEAERSVFEIGETRIRFTGGPQNIKTLLTRTIDRIDQLYQSESPITGLPTGFADLDRMTSGLQNGDMVVVAGRPSMGKTAFSMNLAEHVAIKSQKTTLIFSMEMPAEQLAMRMMSSLGRIDQHKVRTGQLQDEDWPRLTSAVGLLAETPLFIDDTPALSPSEIKARARRLAREQGPIGLIIIDYLQLMRVPGYRGDNRVAEISDISRSLKTLAKELNVPVIALSQLNRGLEQRPNKRPIMSDLRESGAIEQDADVIMFIYRDEVYNEDSQDKGSAEIIIAKQRNGPIGTLRLTFLGKYTRFESFTEGYKER